MTSEHQALLFLPDALRDAGLPFGELTGWKSNQQNYYWTDPNNMHHGYLGIPNGWVWHHTATTGYTPVVKNSSGQTKANIYIGIWRNGRLWSSGNGPAMIVLASSGPANFSNGKGRRNVLTNYVNLDVRFPGPQTLPDDDPPFYGNRYYGGTEVVHPGDRSPVDSRVWDLQVELAAIMSRHWGWSEFRHIGHLDHTKRKIDQRFEQGAPYTIRQHQDEVAALLSMEDDMFLQEGDKAFAVAKYKKALNAWAAATGSTLPPLAINSTFDSAMGDAVEAYHEASQLDDTQWMRDHGNMRRIYGITADLLNEYNPEIGGHPDHDPKPHEHPFEGKTHSN